MESGPGQPLRAAGLPLGQPPDSHPDKSTVLAVLQLLRKYNLKSTEESLLREANVNLDFGGGMGVVGGGVGGMESEVNQVLSAYKSEGDPRTYEDAYVDLKRFVENALDTYKHELGLVLYPVFVHMYLELVYNGHEAEAVRLMERFGGDQEDYYQADLRRLAQVTRRQQMDADELADTFKSNEFIIRMSRDTLSLLKRHLQAEKRHGVLLNIVQEHLYFDMYEGVARGRRQIDATAGAALGEATRQDNKARVYYGMPKEPDIQYVPADEEEEGGGGGGGGGGGEGGEDRPKKKKAKKDPLLYKKAKNDPNAPAPDRLPLPELKDSDKLEKIKAMREAVKRVTLGPENLPSICCYTLLNSNNTVCCAEISDDSTVVAAGFANALIKVWSLMPQKLRSLKPAEVLQEIDIEAEDVLARIMDDRGAETSRSLVGHNGPVYHLTFSPDKSLLVSCSEDATVRLWSLMTWTCLVAYKGHVLAVWDVRFSPHGHYFATAGQDRTARLWATDHHQPLRLFAGHFSDVDCVQFHPNSNYVATGSSDRTVRLWDCATGNNVRLMTGHKGLIFALAFSTEGRFLVSAGADGGGRLLVWDLAHGHLLAELASHSAPVHALAFSRDGHLLASGSLDCSIKLWDFAKLTEEVTLEDVNISHNPEVKRNADNGNYLLSSYATKNSPVLGLHFSRRNVLMAVCTYDSS